VLAHQAAQRLLRAPGPGQAHACNARKLACTGCSTTLRARAEAEACTRPRYLRGRERGARPHLGARLQARRGRRKLAYVPELDHAVRRACHTAHCMPLGGGGGRMDAAGSSSLLRPKEGLHIVWRQLV